MNRVPHEVTVGGVVLRGIRVEGGDQGLLLLVHDVGSDLDEFGRLPETLATLGCDVIALDLPGHGLSDGDAPEGGGLLDAVRAVVTAFDDERPLGLVASGRTASVGVVLGRPDGVDVQVLVRPVLDDGVVDAGRRAHAVRLVLHDDGEHLAGTATQRFFGRLIGEKMLLHHHGVGVGAANIATDTTLASHVRLFVHRYLLTDAAEHRVAHLSRGVPDGRGG